MDSSSSDPLKTAAAYLQNGWRVVPIPARSKGPTIDAWQNCESSNLICQTIFRPTATSAC